jgi:pyridoxine 4-dehydrogenase
VRDVASRHGATPTQVVLAWLLARSPAMLPIPGTGSVAHLEENVAAAGLKLTPAEVASISGRE